MTVRMSCTSDDDYFSIKSFTLCLNTGAALSARHSRNGRELPMIAENKHYDFNYQVSLYTVFI